MHTQSCVANFTPLAAVGFHASCMLLAPTWAPLAGPSQSMEGIVTFLLNLLWKTIGPETGKAELEGSFDAMGEVGAKAGWAIKIVIH